MEPTPRASHAGCLTWISSLLILWVCLVVPVRAQQAMSLDVSNDGVTIACGSFGSFTLSYPELDVDPGQSFKPLSVNAAGDNATVKYAGGAEVDVTVTPDGHLTYSFVNPPEKLTTYRMTMLIDFGFREAGKWKIGSGQTASFPQQKPPQPHLYQGNSTTFDLTDFEGKTLSFTVPDYSYEEFNDNREWNWNIYNWMFIAPFDKNNPKGAVSVEFNTVGSKNVVLVDQFGQDAATQFPGKVSTIEDLKRDVTTENSYYASFHPPIRDIFGGLPDSGAGLGLTRTGFFHVQKHGAKWFMVDPIGNAYFHLGICGFQPGDDYTYVKDRQQVYAWLPPYDSEYKTAFSTDAYWSRDVFSFYIANLIRKYGSYDLQSYQERMITRVRRFGYNSIGAFSAITDAARKASVPWTDILPLSPDSLGGTIDGLRGIFDPFKPGVAQNMDAAFAKSVGPEANEPLLIGGF